MSQPKDAEVVEYAQELLEDGALPATLVQALMDEFELPPTKARKLARKALKLYKKKNPPPKPPT